MFAKVAIVRGCVLQGHVYSCVWHRRTRPRTPLNASRRTSTRCCICWENRGIFCPPPTVKHRSISPHWRSPAKSISVLLRFWYHFEENAEKRKPDCFLQSDVKSFQTHRILLRAPLPPTSADLRTCKTARLISLSLRVLFTFCSVVPRRHVCHAVNGALSADPQI